ncbi:FadR family transcriptional regulator [Labedella populi]|uniref:FadR family transcriptional regulator n=1 Tax=Labedella populi TaxID=2498850 RepID=A0A3S4E7F8_9MICO|nr:FadR/GntR family transcriptional regulator [Labedella populi]RWZ68027.1 FadR family transcriptional regulator [Labedella populi]
MTDETRAWQTVLRSVETDLLAGVLKPGDRLPGERALATDLGVGRSSVREALRVLEVLGLIRTATGSGPSSGAIIVSTPRGGMSALLRLQVAASGFAVADIVDTRLVLETSIAATLARHAASGTAPKLTESESLLDAMEDASLSPAEFLALDARFHASLAEAAGNQVIVATMAGLRDSIESYVVAGVPTLPSWPDAVARLMREHRDILAAVRAGDADHARGVVHDHITGYYAETGLSGSAAAAASPHSAPTSTEGPIA